MEIEEEVAKKGGEFAQEVLRYMVAELHVQAILGTATIATAHKFSETKIGIGVSVIVIIGMIVVKRQYHAKFAHFTRLDYLINRIRGRHLTLDGVHYRVGKGGYIRPYNF